MGKPPRKPREGLASAPAGVPISTIPAPNWKWLIGLILLAFALRIPFLGRSDLWVDELLFMWDSQLPMSPWQVWLHHYNKFPVAGHLPLGAMFHNLFLHLTGQPAEAVLQNPLLQRIPALIWGTLSVPMLYLAVRRLAGETLGRMTGFLYAVSFYPVFYSREAYYYAPLMFFACLSLRGFAVVMESTTASWRPYLVWMLALMGTVLVHISGVLMPLAFVLAALIALIATYVKKDHLVPLPEQRAKIGRLLLIPLVSTLPLVPFILIRMKNPGQQALGSVPEWWIILYDVIGKTFLGIAPVAFIFAVLFFAAGVWHVLRTRGTVRYAGIVILLLMTLVLIGALKSQYSSRYFTVASPGMYLLFAAGFYQIATAMFRRTPRRAELAGWGMIAVFTIIQVGLFHSLAYQLDAKSRHYGGMANWINENLPSGGAYILESGYDVRFLGQYHTTPRRTPVIPFFHSTAADVQRLRETQQALMYQHPDMPFVEAARHGTEFKANVPVWTWPHSYYRQRYDVWNKPLQRLVGMGIWPQIHASALPDIEYHTVIWYNTEDDVLAIAKEQGKKARFVFDSQWEFAQVAQGLYMRAHPPSRARIGMQATGDNGFSGRLRVVGSVASREPVAVRLEHDGRVIASARWETGRLQEMIVPGFIATGMTNEFWLISDPQKQAAVQAILVSDVQLE